MGTRTKSWGKLKPPAGATILWGDPINNGLIAFYLMSEGSGPRIFDITKRWDIGVHSATAVWAPSRFGKGMNFGSDLLAIPTSTKLDLPTAHTIVTWVRPDTISGDHAIIMKGQNGVAYSSYHLKLGVCDGEGSNGKFNYTVRATGVPNGFVAIQTTTPVAGQWYQVVGSQSADLASLRLYVNGRQEASVSSAGNTPYVNTTALNIGADAGPRYGFGGIIDHIRFYNRELNAAEVWRLYTNPFAGVAPPRRRVTGRVATGIKFDAASNSGYQAAASTYNWSHTCTGTNRELIVGVSMLSLAQTVTGITYNSVPLIFLGAQSSVSGAARVELWGLVNPSLGANTIEVTLSGAIASAANASSYTGVHQTFPTEAFNSAQATNVGAADATVDVTTIANNDWVVDILATDDTAVTVGAGQTQTGNVSGAGGSGTMSYEGPKATPGAVTMSWTNVAALATWAIGAIGLRPIAASNPPSTGSGIMTPRSGWWGDL